MATYQSLGVKRIVNAAGFNSRYGSSCMSAEVAQAMAAAAQSFVDMYQLHEECGKVTARITGGRLGQ